MHRLMGNTIKRSQRGFTLVEMAVVIAIIGVLAAVATPLLTSYLSGAKERAYNADRLIIQEAVDAYFGAPRTPGSRARTSTPSGVRTPPAAASTSGPTVTAPRR
jgi:prepilin-type N-terminal cleavage/methylation domain-containing protein